MNTHIDKKALSYMLIAFGSIFGLASYLLLSHIEEKNDITFKYSLISIMISSLTTLLGGISLYAYICYDSCRKNNCYSFFDRNSYEEGSINVSEHSYATLGL